MKNTYSYLVLLLILPLFFSACRKEGAGFTMNYRADFEIGAGLGVFDIHGFRFENIPSNINTYLRDNSLEIGDIQTITPRRGQLSINFADVEFAFVREVIVEIYTDDDPVGREIFYREQIPTNTGIRIDLVPSLPDVIDYVSQEDFNIRVEMRFRDISPQFIETRFDFEFRANL